MMRQLSMSACVLFAAAASATADPVFRLDFIGPDSIAGTPGLSIQIPLIVRLKTTKHDIMFPDDGATAWSLSISSEVATIFDASLLGTAGAATDDIPPGLRDPLAGFEVTSLTSGAGNEGAVSTVVLDVLDSTVQLPPSITSSLLSLTLLGTIPAAGVTEVWHVFTKDGLRSPDSVVFENTVTWRNMPVVPVGAEMFVEVTGVSNQVGDTNNDGLVNIDDLNNVRNNFGESGPADGSLEGDAVPFDGMVDIDDLNGVRNHFGAGAAAVPEPATALLLLGGLVACAASTFRRRAAAAG